MLQLWFLQSDAEKLWQMETTKLLVQDYGSKPCLTGFAVTCHKGQIKWTECSVRLWGRGRRTLKRLKRLRAMQLDEMCGWVTDASKGHVGAVTGICKRICFCVWYMWVNLWSLSADNSSQPFSTQTANHTEVQVGTETHSECERHSKSSQCRAQNRRLQS